MEKYTEEYVHKKLAEFINLKHRCQRYWKRLIKESLKTAKERDLEIRIGEGPLVFEEGKINVFNTEDELYDENLLKLSKTHLPGLYFRFKRDYAKYQKVKKELREIRDYFS